MKEILFEKKITSHTSVKHRDVNLFDSNMNLHQALWTCDKKSPGLFIPEETFNDEVTFVNEIQNPIFTVIKNQCRIVVDKSGDKIALKFFTLFTKRDAGKKWYSIIKNVNYISVNKKNGDVYIGHILNYQKKRKASKQIRRNFFLNNSINSLVSQIKNSLTRFNLPSKGDFAIDACRILMEEIDPSGEINNMDFHQRLFRFHLTKKNIKIPNNFYLFNECYFGPKLKKELKKHEGRLVESFMALKKYRGKLIKKALHECSYLNFQAYDLALELFGENWINQSVNLPLQILNSKVQVSNFDKSFKQFLTKQELKQVFEIYKEVFINQTLDVYSFFDHIRIYVSLKNYGEVDLKWKATTITFRDEHLDWTDKLEFYRLGNYKRIYPNYFYESVENEIDGFYPKILDETSNYNDESFTQKNCVKTYIGRTSSLIVSLRKGSFDSLERATLEYRFIKHEKGIKIERVQSLGKYNSLLTDDWNEVLQKLDTKVSSIVEDKNFETVKIIKQCKNGVILKSDSEWAENGNLIWSENKHSKNKLSYLYFDEF